MASVHQASSWNIAARTADQCLGVASTLRLMPPRATSTQIATRMARSASFCVGSPFDVVLQGGRHARTVNQETCQIHASQARGLSQKSVEELLITLRLASTLKMQLCLASRLSTSTALHVSATCANLKCRAMPLLLVPACLGRSMEPGNCCCKEWLLADVPVWGPLAAPFATRDGITHTRKHQKTIDTDIHTLPEDTGFRLELSV